MEDQTIEDFEYTKVADVDPNFATLPQDVYTLEIVKAGPKEFEYKADSAKVKKGDVAKGDKGRFYKFDLLIVDHDKFNGQHVFPALFPSDFTLRAFRRIMDATGHEQGDMSISEWLVSMAAVQPRLRFKTLVEQKLAKDSTPEFPKYENDVSFKEVLPA